MLLFAAGTDARIYEQELRALGLPTFRATGRDYYHQQQVVDLLAYLRLLHNRYDDEALVTVLASPFVGVSNNGAAPPAARGREASALLRAREVRPRRALASATRSSSARSASATTGWRAWLARLSLERLCERIITEHDYDLAVLAQWDGRRRYANLRKLARLARSYEELRGPDVEGFVRFVRELDTVGASELEAVAEEEGTDVIRLLTIHGAKGLEFKVVVVADAGRHGAARDADEILCLPDGRLGFRVADPSTGKRRPTSDYQEVKEAEDEASEAERRRLYYVAMTRAIDRLIVSGSIDPERSGDESTPIGWVLGRLEAPELESAGGAPVEIDRDGARLMLRVDRFTPGAAQNGRGRRRGVAARPVRRRGRPGRDRGGAAPAGARSGARAAGEPRPQALVQRTGSLRALLVPLLRRAFRRAARDEADARRRRPRARAGRDRDRRLGTRDPRGARPCRSAPARGHGRCRARPLPDGLRRRGRAHRRARRGVLQLGDRAAARGPPGRDGRALVRLRAGRRL